MLSIYGSMMEHYYILCTSSHAASLHQAVLRKFEDDFIKVVKADHELRTLLRKEVIHQEAQMDIERARTDKAAREILFEHLFYSGNLLTLKTYCKEIIEAKGLPLMQDLGRKMMAELEERGQLDLWYKKSVVLCG